MPCSCDYRIERLFLLFQYLCSWNMKPTLLRPANLLDRDPVIVESFLDFLLSISHLQEVFFAWRPALTDPDDDFILE
jgi:hypothetical protein